MVGVTQDPLEYIRLACEVHLGQAPTKESVQRVFATTQHDGTEQQQESSSANSNTNTNTNNLPNKITCVFVWLDHRTGTARIGETLPERYDSAVAFVGAAATKMTTAGEEKEAPVEVEDDAASSSWSLPPLQCVTLQPSWAAAAAAAAAATEHTEKIQEEEDEDEDATAAVTTAPPPHLVEVDAPRSHATLLAVLQLYTRHVFLPAIRTSSSASSGDEGKENGTTTTPMPTNTAVVQDKIRELEVAIQQSQRSAQRLPTITLTVETRLARVVTTHQLAEEEGGAAPPGGTLSNVDWTAFGLETTLHDDQYLNGLQTGVSRWIGQIRKLTILPRTTPFPLLTEATAMEEASGTEGGGGPAIDELAFWHNLHDELHHVKAQLQSPGVQLTLSLLREAKRFVATLALENNTGLDGSIAYVKDVEHFLTPYPAPDLVTARTFDKLGTVVQQVFNHVPKIRQSRYYTLERLAQLVSATTVTLSRALGRVLRDTYGGTHSSKLVLMDYKDYERTVRYPTQDVFVQFDDRYAEFKEFFVEQGRRRNKLGGGGTTANTTTADGTAGDTTIDPVKILDRLTLYQKPLEHRLDQIHDFRAGHERLRQVVLQVLTSDEGGASGSGSDSLRSTPESTTGGGSGSGDGRSSTEAMADETSSAIQTVENAPRLLFASLDVMDLSPGGTTAFEAALEEYDLRMDAMEERLAKLLRDKLTACTDAEDMFLVFKRFNPLLSRSRVRIAVKEFQVQLIATVSKAIEKLQSKFVLKYESSSAARLSKLRGIPPVSGKILWAKQMERQIHLLMERCSQVLGENWGGQLEGRTLRKNGDDLLSKLNPTSFFRKWITEWEKELTIQASSRLHSFPIVVEKDLTSNELIVTVNFSEKMESLNKEIRQLIWLGYEKEIPRSILTACEESKQRYPFAIAIKTALRSYHSCRTLITPSLEPLVMPQLLDVREIISDGFEVKLSTSKAISKKRRIRWDSSPKDLSEWATKLSDSVTKLEERAEELLLKCDDVDAVIEKLKIVDYSSKKFETLMSAIQKIIDDMSLGGYPQLSLWVKSLDNRLSMVLADRLSSALKNWNHTFRTMKFDKDGTEIDDGDNDADTMSKTGGAVTYIVDGTRLHFTSISIDILLRNQEISSVPAVPTVRSLVLNRLHSFMGIVCNLKRPKSGRYEVFDDASSVVGDKFSSVDGSGDGSSTFDRIISMIPSDIISKSYELVEERINDMAMFVDQWLAYQTLWDTQVADVATMVGTDIEKWQLLLKESAEARSAVDMSATSAEFGPMIVKYSKVQSQITLKYDSWQKELQSSFASILGQCIHESHVKMEDAKMKLEKATLESSSGTENIVLGVTFIQEMKKNTVLWSAELDELEASERLIKRQRYHFNSEWMETTVVQGQFGLVKQVLARRITSMEQQFPLLQARVSAEEKSAAKRTVDLVESWSENKPLRGTMSPATALNTLAKFETDLNKAKTHQENLIRAKDALGLEHTVEGNAISDCLDELINLKEVWDAVSKPFDQLQTINDQLWTSAIMRKVRRALDDLLAEMRSMPNRIRQYEPFIALHDKVKGYVSGHSLMSELKTEALKERHWKTILKTLNITSISYSQLTIGLLWEKGVLTRKKEIGEILTVAQGEMALEQFLAQVRDRWMKQELELVLFQNRVRLIRGWEDLFANLDDHIGGLALMKSSPYYRAVREFQEEGKLWEDRLTQLRTAFDVWIDVQRRWVYLEGILFGSSDIKAQLPSEWSRFKSVDSEFIALMRRIASRPFAMEVLNIENVQRTLERLGNLMSVIQKALGEYLEKQRREFARFYFLGDDDLLEILGNSGEPGKVLGHVSKMFAGISSARLSTTDLPDDTLAVLDAMVSKDGEVVPFHEPITIRNVTNVKEWLKEVESKMKNTLALLLEQAITEDKAESSDNDAFVNWASKFPAQVMILATQINWSMGVDEALNCDNTEAALNDLLSSLEGKLAIMAETVLLELPADSRKKFEQMITELVHQRDVVRGLIKDKVSRPTDFRWLYHLRYTYNPEAPELTEKLMISLSNANFYYGFEYLGIGERLVQTPLTDKAYLTLTQALHFRMGGSPFGPAGTGKTETVKALGAQLGRFVLVFNCDEAFDFSAMGRIFAGLCQVGAWGCFDEFNRLEEGILSAVSQQILGIQQGLLNNSSHIDLLGRQIRLDSNMATFITMNPGYAGRSNLPDNLKSLFRSVAMVVPDRKLIAQVMLYSQGIVTAEKLAPSVVDLFLLCEDQMTKQRHYDFGLRALKTLLVSAGGLKRKAIEGRENFDLSTEEEKALIKGACNNILPKLVAEDVSTFSTILKSVFPKADVSSMEDDALREAMTKICEAKGYVAKENFVQKMLQLNQVIASRHGVMVVGENCVGKSTALKVLLASMEKVDGVKGELYVIDPKAIAKEKLYGNLDGTTLEWTDGIFTSLLRKIIDNHKGESERRHWIVFDGDVDPEWAENLNSVLDDNKMLTLPSGERLSIPNNIRLILEVDNLNFATPATVSRCGMVFFNENTISVEMNLERMMLTLEKKDLGGGGSTSTQILFLQNIRSMVSSDRTSSLVIDALDFALEEKHIMDASRGRSLHTLETLLLQGIGQTIAYDENHPDFPMTGEHMEKFSRRWLLHSLMWSFVSSASWDVRKKFGDMLLRTSGIQLPSSDKSLVDYRVRVEDGEYELWSESVPRMEIESHRVNATDLVITTTDTVRHSDVLGAWLESRSPLILCGPPGSGKTMTLTSVLSSIQGVVFTSLNFSSRTTPDIILKSFHQYCKYVRRGREIFLEPAESLGSDVWLVVFCDEINLPEEDAYGTQRVIMFMRQLVEQGGFWREDNVWVKINRIQFVGACNPPTDAGRVELSHRFLRHVPLLLVDFPETDSLMQIYRTFNGGMMKLFPSLRGEADAMTEAMIEVYTINQKKFTAQQQPQYIYSPRELSRWVRGIYEAVVHMDAGLSKEELCRIWAHEGLRLFCDRLVEDEDRTWCRDNIDEVARKWFAGVDFDIALKRPIFYTTWLSKETRKVEKEELKEFLAARLRVFYEEMLDVKLVVFDEVLEHILRIDRVLRQPMGHLLLCGDAGAGKTVLTKFVSWMNGLNVFQIKAHSKYGLSDFYEDLRDVMKRVALKGEKVCFIFDEANCLNTSFIEAMNALLASGEVPGLFEGDEYAALMNACRDSALKEGVILDSDEELWNRFTSLVQKNLHVVFTMNPSGGDWKNRSTTSPALFNRCVVDWFGTWGDKAMAEVGKEFTIKIDIGELGGYSYGLGEGAPLMDRVSEVFEGNGGLRQAVVAALVDLHLIAKQTADDASSQPSSVSRTYLSPRDYLTLIQNFVSCLNKRREEIEDEQLHVNAGLQKLQQTQENVAELKTSLGEKTHVLRDKEKQANEKLQQMVADQNVAEKRKDEAEKMSESVQKQQVRIDERKEEAQRDLNEAEPALRAAQASVQGIKKRDLDEIKGLARPPDNVRLTLECVAIMLGESKVEWGSVRKLLAKSEFIPSILKFDANSLSQKQIKHVREKYLDGNKDLSVEKVYKSSTACGPLYAWAESLVKYSTVYNRIQPLRDEVEQLEMESSSVKEKLETVQTEVTSLEESIGQYKADYATLIRDVEALKSEMESVSKKVDRAESLLKSLGHESDRWHKSTDGFQSILRSLVGDSLLLGAFLTYSGFFDFKNRSIMMGKWKHTLETLGIECHEDLGIVESLSTGKQRMQWKSEGLLDDQLSMENGVILEHAVRFPLLIDPSGNAINFLMKKFESRKIQKTSFLDKAFVKTLAGAVRFGTSLMVENVEHIDPILNPLLNKELQRTGGRTLVRIGTEDIDYSPDFMIVLSTKNPAVYLTPDVCSRVTLANFTVTPASLQSQSLSKVLSYEKPELETQRAAVLKLQGEQNVKLRELEDKMLAKISACEGSILESDDVVAGMEVLMKEGTQVEEQIEQSEKVMTEVHAAVSEFEPFAAICRNLFVLLSALREVSFLYEFSSNTFMTILKHVLEENHSSSASSGTLRIAELKKALFSELVARIARGLKSNDKVAFSVLLARLFTSNDSFCAIATDCETTDDYVSAFTQIFGNEFNWQGRDDLHAVVQEIDSTSPLLICSAPGYDVSGRVESMAHQMKKELHSVAMGSSEGFDTAESLVTTASKRGTWVMLKNVHLATDWLNDTFVKKLQTFGHSTNKDFRLFITSEISPKLPTALLQLSDVIVAEASSGIKASITRFISSISTSRLESSLIRNRLYLLVAWTHAVLEERVRYGWTYELAEADSVNALEVIDDLINAQIMNPDLIPFDALCTTLKVDVFGSRIAIDEDQNTINVMIDSIFTKDAFDLQFKLVPAIGDDSPTLPDSSARDDIHGFIASLPSHAPPTWVGLSEDAEMALEKIKAENIHVTAEKIYSSAMLTNPTSK